MNPPQQFTNVSSPTTTVQSVEISIQNLIKNWHRRHEWRLFFNPTLEQNLITNTSSWRNQLAKFLESTTVRAITISLILFDLILTIIELSSSFLRCSMAPIKNNWYHWIGIGILTLLSAKTVALAIGLGSVFFTRPGFVIDGVVVIGAMFLEAFLDRNGGGLIVVVSLWRVLRVVESAFELSDEAIEAQIEGIVCQFEALRDENIKLVEIIDEKDKVIEKLQEQLDQQTQHTSKTSNSLH